MTMDADWTTLESLLLTQAVYKYGDDNWNTVARVLRQHPSVTRKSLDFFAAKVRFFLARRSQINSFWITIAAIRTALHISLTCYLNLQPRNRILQS